MNQPPPIQQPPFGTPYPSPKRSPTTAAIIIIICAAGFFCLIVPILAAILLPVFMQARNSAKNTACMKNLKLLATSSLMYAAENDDRLPLASNWNDALRKVVPDDKAFGCPGVPHQMYGYAYSDAVSGLSLIEVEQPKNEPMIFDSYLREPNAHSDLSTLSTSGRHTKTNIAYVDGHVASLKPEQLK